MKARVKLIASCVAFALVIATMAFGVYAAVTVSHNLQNSINYVPGQFHRASFSTIIQGASQTGGEVANSAEEIDDLGPYSYDSTQGASGSTANIGQIYFVSNPSGGTYDIVFVISVSNVGTESNDESFRVSIDYSRSTIQTSGTDIIRSAEERTIGLTSAEQTSYTSAGADTAVEQGYTMVIKITYTMENPPTEAMQNNLVVNTVDVA